MSATLWNETREQLKAIMKKEIAMMREILANMHQEEETLSLGDTTSWENVMGARASLMQHLVDIRQWRFKTTQTLDELIPFSDKKVPLEQMLALDDESYGEITLLRDQITALLQRITFQNTRNQALFEQHRFRTSNFFPPPPALNQKRRNVLATYDPAHPEKD